MLAHAAAAIAKLEISVGEHARVQRVLRELDTEDLLVLHALWLTRSGPRTERCERFHAWERADAESLVASGCVRIDIRSEDKWDSTTFQTADVTGTGRLVLRVLNDFIRSKGPFETLAGHDVDAFLTRAQVFALLERVPGLLKIVEKHRSAGFSGLATYNGRGQSDDNGSLHLTLSEEDFEELHRVLPEPGHAERWSALRF